MMRLGAPLLLLGIVNLPLQADFKVSESRDKVTLKDGREIEGIIVASGRKAVVIVVEEEDSSKEMVLPRDDVKSVKKGGVSPRTKAFTTDPKDGVKVVTGEGFRDIHKPKKKTAKKAKNNKKQQPRKQQAKKDRRAAQITPQMIRQLAAKDPRIKAFVRMAGGADKAAKMLNDPKQRKRLEDMARRMKIQIPKTF